MLILGFDTSGSIATSCVMKDDNVLSFVKGDVELKHAETIIPIIKESLNKANLSIDDLDYIACDIGPGSFTGVRIGVSVANAFGFAKQKTLIGVSSLKAMIESIDENKYICALIDARNDSAYSYGINKNKEELFPLNVYTISDVVSKCPSDTIFIGNVPSVCSMLIEPDAEMLCRYAFKHTDDAVSFLKPDYYRPSQAERVKYGS